MKFDIARQAFIPSFLTLAALAATAVYGPVGAVVSMPEPQLSGIWMPGELLLRFQAAFPSWARALTCLLIVVAGIRTGHLTVRYNLYTMNTCIAIPLYGVLAGGLTAGAADLPMYAGALFLVLSIKNFCRSYSTSYAFDAIFRGALHLGILLILAPKTLPLVLLLPLAVFHFHRTFRELLVALAGLLLPVLLLCYVNWGAGAEFHAPLLAMGETLLEGEWLRIFLEIPFGVQVLAGGAALLLIFALQYFYADLYAVSSRSRSILVYHLEALLLIGAVACLPGATAAVFALAAVPLSVLLPLFFVRAHPGVAQPIYALCLAGSVCNMILQ
ncbi:MAG: hypothetical protein K2I13_01845 [Alistipes sp.]|nr:hypothetical protein [Alistipes sp.]